jgi:BirA family biotin operon repressor/biotin-[acetyl-CoA-carboxylase] ligase
VLLSALFFPPPELRRAAVLTAWAAVAVCDTVAQASGVTPAIKWPNDVLVGSRKICGILTEQARGTVVGVGLNVNQTDEDFRAAGLPEATSLKLISGRSFDCDDITRLLIGRLDDSYERLCHGDLRTLESAWEERIGLTGAAVSAECLDGDYRGRLLGLGFDGVVLDLGGRRSHLSPEMIRHLRPL